MVGGLECASTIPYQREHLKPIGTGAFKKTGYHESGISGSMVALIVLLFVFFTVTCVLAGVYFWLKKKPEDVNSSCMPQYRGSIV